MGGGDGVEGGGRTVGVRAVIRRVVPAIGADLHAERTARGVQRFRHVQAFGNGALAEGAVAVVGVDRVQQGRVLRGDAQAERHAQPGVQAYVETADRAQVGGSGGTG